MEGTEVTASPIPDKGSGKILFSENGVRVVEFSDSLQLVSAKGKTLRYQKTEGYFVGKIDKKNKLLELGNSRYGDPESPTPTIVDLAVGTQTDIGYPLEGLNWSPDHDFFSILAPGVDEGGCIGMVYSCRSRPCFKVFGLTKGTCGSSINWKTSDQFILNSVVPATGNEEEIHLNCKLAKERKPCSRS